MRLLLAHRVAVANAWTAVVFLQEKLRIGKARTLLG
jgi:hypothetical protein